MNIQEAIKKVIENQDLTFEEAYSTMNAIMTGEGTPAQIACIITALRMKNETINEIAGFAKAMQEMATDLGVDGTDFIDVVGTGGDRKHTFNISTASAFIAAGAGAKVAKHGNRSVSSKCGSADVLSACGVNIQAPIEKVSLALNKIGIAFLFAPLMHKAMKYAIGPRKEIAIRTIFNILGPLTNPLKTKKQLIGVYDVSLVKRITNVLQALGLEKAYVVHGMEGLDEISISGNTKIGYLVNNETSTFKINPTDMGLKEFPLDAIKGGSAIDNAEIMKKLFKGEMKESAIENICVINSAFAIHLTDACKSPKDGVEIALDSIRSGKAMEKLQALIDITNS
ncbi:MAG: anthranilate phosphoribosyltransferase [Candidatus Aureabacteria bacterium]|nr:anthranilate phosphoribosyltransferase [Candidatus Auribacterota bacterium]